MLNVIFLNIILKSLSESMWLKPILLNSSILQNHIVNLTLLTNIVMYCSFHINYRRFRILHMDGSCTKREHIWPMKTGLEKIGHFVFTYRFIKLSPVNVWFWYCLSYGVIIVCYCVLLSAQTNCPLYKILKCSLVTFPPKGGCCSFKYN